MKKILVDGRSVEPYYINGTVTGVGRSTLELINSINNTDNLPFEIILYSQNLKGIGFKSNQTKLRKLHFFIPKRKLLNKIIHKLKLKKLFSQYDLMHIPHNTDLYENLNKTVFTIHDLIVYRYPEIWGLTEKERIEHKKIAEGCKAIITCSQTSKKDIVKFWDITPEKVHVIYWGINRNIFYPDSQSKESLSKFGIYKDFFFCSSCNHPRKQARLILEAYKNYVEKGGSHQMVMLGLNKEDLNGYEDLTYGEEKRIIILKGIRDDDLRKLYSKAKASIIVSLYEGFGFPILESLACHTPVISAKNSSLTEIGEGVSDFIENVNAKSLETYLIKYEKMQKERILDILKVENHLSKFTWENTARSYINLYNHLLNE